MPAPLSAAAERALTFAIRHVNASLADPIDGPALLAALTAERVPPVYETRSWFDERAEVVAWRA